MPLFYVGNETGLLPVDLVVFGAGVLDDGRFLEIPPSSMGSVFIESGSEVSTSLADIHLATFAGDPVNAGLGLGVLFVLV